MTPEETTEEFFTDEEYAEGFKDGQEALKSALLEEIEKEIRINSAYEDPFDCGRESGLGFLLQLLDTITPRS